VSTILKALQRLEDEKNANTERSLNEQVVARRPPRRPERSWLTIGAVAIGGIAFAAAAAFLFWPTRENSDSMVAMESTPIEVAPAITTKDAEAAKKPRRRSSARPVPAARAQQKPSDVEISPVVEVVKRLDAPSADSAASAASPKRAARRAEDGPQRPAGRRSRARKPNPQVARGDAQVRPDPKQIAIAEPPAIRVSENSVPAKPTPEQPAPVETAEIASKPAPPAPVQQAAAVPEPAPTAPVQMAAVVQESAPPDPIPAAVREPEKKVIQRAKFPSLSVEKTIWHPDTDRRVAVVKLADADEVLRLKEGDAIGPLVVEVIKPGSVLFNHDGIEIQYDVGG
jgi:hypothetical protein